MNILNKVKNVKSYTRLVRQGFLSQQRNHSVSVNEVDHFNELAKTWWDWDGGSRLLHLMNSTRLDFMTEVFRERNCFSGKKILDIGCGGGILSESMARLGASVTAVDASPMAIEVAKKHASLDPVLNGRLEYIHGSVEGSQLPTTFDVVTCMEVLEHVEQPRDFLFSLMEKVKPNGRLVLSTISRTLLARLLTITLAEHVLRIVPVGTHTFEKFIRADELSNFLKEQNWIINDIRGVCYNPLKQQWTLDKPGSSGLGLSCNYFLSAQKPMSA